VERDAGPLVRVVVDGEFVVAAAEVLQERVTGRDSLQGPGAFESAHRPQPGFESSVVGFDRVVRVLLGECRAEQATSSSTRE